MTEAAGNIELWLGRWRWNGEATQFGAGHEPPWTEQYQYVERGSSGLLLRTEQHLADGTTKSWTFDGAFDGRPRAVLWDDGTPFMVIAFSLLGDRRGADAYQAADGSFVGAEYFDITEESVKVYGSTTVAGTQHPYLEVWDRA